jgi:hypothetical protein
MSQTKPKSQLKSKAKAKHQPKATRKRKAKPKPKARRKIDGILPSPKWLQSHGGGGLVRAMREHPEAFAHIPQATD